MPAEFTEKTVQRPIELALVIVAVIFLQRPFVALSESQTPGQVIGLVFIIAAQALVAMDCLFPRDRSWTVVGLSIAGVVTIVVAELLRGGDHAVWRTDVLLGTQLVYLALLYLRGRQLLVLAGTALAGLVTLASVRDVDWTLQTLSLMFLAASLGLLVLGRIFVSAIIEDHVAAQQVRARELRTHESAQGRAEALAAIRRDAHDSILHSLQLVAAGPLNLSEDLIRRSCAETSRLQTGLLPPAHSDPSPHLDDALRSRLSTKSAKLKLDLERVSVPSVVADALLRAAVEAVRNVIKHTPDRRATVTLRSSPEAVRLEIRDQGPGFDVAQVSSGSMGLSDSITSRMTDVGGAAQITSGRGGTTVSLSWPAPDLQTRIVLGPRARPALAVVPLPLVFASLVHVTITHPGMDIPQTFVPWALLTAVVLFASATVRRTGLRDVQAWLLCAVALGGLAYNYLMVGTLGRDVWSIWVPSLAGAMAILALPGRRIRTALAMAGVLLGGHVMMSVLALGWRTTFVEHFGAIVSLAIDVVITLVLVVSTETVARYEWRDLQQRARIAHQQRIAAEREGIWRDWLARAHLLAGSFLDDVASGRLPVDSPTTKAHAVRLEARLRDELRLWPGDAEVAEELDRLRGLGWRCRFDLEAPSPAVRQALAEVLRRLGDPARPGQSLAITARDEASVITVTNPALSTGQCGDVSRWIEVVDEDFTQIRPSIPQEVHS